MAEDAITAAVVPQLRVVIRAADKFAAAATVAVPTPDLQLLQRGPMRLVQQPTLRLRMPRLHTLQLHMLQRPTVVKRRTAEKMQAASTNSR
jgi:hypothetical protein